MIMYVSVKYNWWKTVGPSFSHIDKSRKYRVKCEKLYHDNGLYLERYKLKLIGKSQNIESFLSYLNYVGFKIKKY